jgi:hypothetical protein
MTRFENVGLHPQLQEEGSPVSALSVHENGMTFGSTLNTQLLQLHSAQ